MRQEQLADTMNKHINIITNSSQNKGHTAPVLPYSLLDHLLPPSPASLTAQNQAAQRGGEHSYCGNQRSRNNEADAMLPVDTAREELLT